MIPVLHGVWAAAGGLVGDFEHIETQTVGAGGAASVTFSSIAGTYKHLQIRGVMRATGSYSADTTNLTFNSDTGSNYSTHTVYGTGSSVAAAASAPANFIWIDRVAGSLAPSSTFGAFVCDILDYASTSKFKTTRNLGGVDVNGSGGIIMLTSGNWRSTSAITSLTLSTSAGGGGNFVQYTTLSLYGVK